MQTFIKYITRIVIFSGLYFLYSFYDPSLSSSFILPNTRDKIAYVSFIAFCILMWKLGALIYTVLDKKYLQKISLPKRTPLLILVFFFYGIFVSLSHSSIYYILDFIVFKQNYEWPGGIPFIMYEMNFGTFQFYLILIVIQGYIYYYRNLQEEKILNEQLKKENIQSKYEVLKNQIDPHFFFNSLSVLTTLVYKDADLSAEYVTQLSKMYRYMLDKDNNSLVELEKELKFLDSYIFLMNIRFKDRISFKIELSEASKTNSYIPPNTLQMLVENAIKHNKFSSENPLNISISEDENNFIITNNLDSKVNIGESSGIGLENIKLRYELLANKKIEINKDKDSFTVVLPKYNLSDYEGIDI
ncbi:MAG: sensor histidine kinase [Salinivirgaceae bacterium]|jgi:two-component system LytT family sensor kinase|nr:sensor histidine kinase [Salinivirgaceae bacterium]